MSAAVANGLNKFWKIALGAGAVGGAIQSALFDVHVGHRVVMYHRFHGVEDAIHEEGTHLLIPWIQTPHYYDIRIMPRQIETQTGTKDLQTVKITLRVGETRCHEASEDPSRAGTQVRRVRPSLDL